MRKIVFITLAASIFSFAAIAQKTKPTNTTTKQPVKMENLTNKTDSVSYALGMLIGKNLKSQGFETLNLEALKKAMGDILGNQPTQIDEHKAQAIVQAYAQEAQKIKSEKTIAEGKAYLEKNKVRPGVVTTASGLQYEVLKEGSGPKPGPTSQVTAHYHGTLPDGTVFDSSVNRNQPFKTGVNQVIPAWQEALQLMSPGTKLRIVCPSEIAYGSRGAGQMIGPNQVLIFEMELISIDKP